MRRSLAAELCVRRPQKRDRRTKTRSLVAVAILSAATTGLAQTEEPIMDVKAAFAKQVPAAAPDCGLRLRLTPPRRTVHAGQPVEVVATLLNESSQPVTLVMPGDGSIEAQRTPIVSWVLEPAVALPMRHCTTIGALRAGEVFTLPAGGAKDLGGWANLWPIPRPGTFRATMTYTNAPEAQWLFAPSSHDPEEMRRVRASDLCSVRSNVIELVVKR